ERAAGTRERALRRRRARQRDYRLRCALCVPRGESRRAGRARRSPGLPPRRLRRSADARDRDARAKTEAHRAVRADDAHVAMVHRARISPRDHRRPAAPEAVALQLSTKIPGLQEKTLGEFDGTNGQLREARPRGRGTRLSAVSGASWQADLRERIERGVAGVAQAPDDARQREPAVARRCGGGKKGPRTEGRGTLWVG